jgi:flagellar hook-associated protein 2
MATTTSPLTANLSSPGIGSGLDINGIVARLMAVERRPLALLDAQIGASQARLSAYGTLKGALAALQTAAETLARPATFRTLAVTSSNPAALGASLGESAVAGAYAIEVTALAQAHKLASGGFAGSSASVGTGTLTIEFGTFEAGVFTQDGSGATAVAIAAGQDSLAGIRDAVNAAAIGVHATVVDDGGAEGAHLVLTSAASGAAKGLRITVADDDANATDAAGLSRLAFDPAAGAGSGRNLDEKVAARDATLVIDGIAVRRPTNTVSGAIEGVTLRLLASNAGAPATLVIAGDDTATIARVRDFVAAYNQVHATLGNLTRYDAATKKASVLTGDGTVRQIQASLRTILGGALSSGTLTTLRQAGAEFKADGTLGLDEAKLRTALETDPAAVTQLFAVVGTVGTPSYSEGFGYRLHRLVDTVLAADGAIAARTGALQRAIDATKDRGDAINQRLAQVEANYLRQFNALDTLLASLNAQSVYLAQQFEMLTKGTDG